MQGDQSVALIETGVSAVVDDVIRQLDSLNIVPSFLVVTHPHADHVTGLPGLRAVSGCSGGCGRGSSGLSLSHPKASAGLVAEDQHMTKFLAEHGVSPGRPPVDEPPYVGDCLIARDGDTMDLGGLTLHSSR